MKNKVFGIFAVILALSLAGCEQPTNTPIVTLSGITAVYNGTATIYPATPLDDLKAGLTVTANYSDHTTNTVAAADYALSGTLTVPSSTVTVTYQGKTDTFAVTVTDPSGGITYSVTQDGGTDNVADSTGMVFTFSASVDSLSLSAADFTVGGAAAKGAELSGTGATRTLAITVSAAGIATVTINKSGIEAETKHLTVYKTGEYAPTLSSITAVYNGTAAVYPATPLNDLKAGLTVKALYSNSSEYTLSAGEYSLSGTLTAPSSTVTVTYQGKTTTFAVTVTAGGNQLPTAHAGTVPTQTLADNLTVTLNGTGSTGNNLAYQWECESYTANKGAVTAEYTKAQVNALITSADQATATVAPRKAGTYVFKLTVTDDEEESDTANVTVVVEGLPVQKDVEVTFPAFTPESASFSLSPTYTPTDGWEYFSASDITSYVITDNKGHSSASGSFSGYSVEAILYTLDTGAVTFTQTFTHSGGTTSSNFATYVEYSGSYNFVDIYDNSTDWNELTAIPSLSLHLEKTITEILPLAAHAQAAPTHTLADNLAITLDGAGSAGNITAYKWECTSHTATQGTVSAEYTPAQATALIANPAAPTTTAAPRKAGTYTFKLTVTANNGDTATDNVTVVVESMIDTRYLTTAQSTFSASDSLDFIVPSFNNVNAMWDGFDVNEVTYSLVCRVVHWNYGPNPPPEREIDLSTYATNKQSIPGTVCQDTDELLITQSFKYKDQIVGQRYIWAQQFSDAFLVILVDKILPDTTAIDLSELTSYANIIPALSLPVSKTITELP